MAGFELVPGYFGPRVRGKLAGQRKDDTYSIQARSDGLLIAQGERAIRVFNFRTRKGLINTKGCYFPDLSPELGARLYEFPGEFVRAALDACPAQDSEITRGGVTVRTTVQVIG